MSVHKFDSLCLTLINCWQIRTHFYQGQPNIILGVAMGLDKPATVAIVDGETGKAIAFRSIKQLLGKNSMTNNLLQRHIIC